MKCYHNNKIITLNFEKSNSYFITEDYLREVFFKLTDNPNILKNIKIVNASAGIRSSLKLVVNNITRLKK